MDKIVAFKIVVVVFIIIDKNCCFCIRHHWQSWIGIIILSPTATDRSIIGSRERKLAWKLFLPLIFVIHDKVDVAVVGICFIFGSVSLGTVVVQYHLRWYYRRTISVSCSDRIIGYYRRTIAFYYFGSYHHQVLSPYHIIFGIIRYCRRTIGFIYIILSAPFLDSYSYSYSYSVLSSYLYLSDIFFGSFFGSFIVMLVVILC